MFRHTIIPVFGVLFVTAINVFNAKNDPEIRRFSPAAVNQLDTNLEVFNYSLSQFSASQAVEREAFLNQLQTMNTTILAVEQASQQQIAELEKSIELFEKKILELVAKPVASPVSAVPANPFKDSERPELRFISLLQDAGEADQGYDFDSLVKDFIQTRDKVLAFEAEKSAGEPEAVVTDGVATFSPPAGLQAAADFDSLASQVVKLDGEVSTLRAELAELKQRSTLSTASVAPKSGGSTGTYTSPVYSGGSNGTFSSRSYQTVGPASYEVIQPSFTPPIVSTTNQWTWPGGTIADLRSHLRGTHGQSIDGLSDQALIQLHSSIHEAEQSGLRRSRTVVNSRNVVSTNNVSAFSSADCPNGQCPTSGVSNGFAQSYSNTKQTTVQRPGLFGRFLGR